MSLQLALECGPSYFGVSVATSTSTLGAVLTALAAATYRVVLSLGESSPQAIDDAEVNASEPELIVIDDAPTTSAASFEDMYVEDVIESMSFKLDMDDDMSSKMSVYPEVVEVDSITSIYATDATSNGTLPVAQGAHKASPIYLPSRATYQRTHAASYALSSHAMFLQSSSRIDPPHGYSNLSYVASPICGLGENIDSQSEELAAFVLLLALTCLLVGWMCFRCGSRIARRVPKPLDHRKSKGNTLRDAGQTRLPQPLVMQGGYLPAPTKLARTQPKPEGGPTRRSPGRPMVNNAATSHDRAPRTPTAGGAQTRHRYSGTAAQGEASPQPPLRRSVSSRSSQSSTMARAATAAHVRQTNRPPPASRRLSAPVKGDAATGEADGQAAPGHKRAEDECQPVMVEDVRHANAKADDAGAESHRPVAARVAPNVSKLPMPRKYHRKPTATPVM